MVLRKKRYSAECKRCKTIRKMRVVGSSDNGKYVWLRCESCHMTYFYSADCFSQENSMQVPLGFKLPVTSKIPTDDVIEYSLYNTYALGQKIFHKRFNDIGEVVSKSKMDQGSKITVSFAKCGEKTLVEGIAL